MTAWDRWRQAARSLFASTSGCWHLPARHHSEFFASSTCSQAACIMLCESVLVVQAPKLAEDIRRRHDRLAVGGALALAPLGPTRRSASRQDRARPQSLLQCRHSERATASLVRTRKAARAEPNMCNTLTPRHHKLLNAQLATATMLSTQHVCLQSICTGRLFSGIYKTSGCALVPVLFSTRQAVARHKMCRDPKDRGNLFKLDPTITSQK